MNIWKLGILSIWEQGRVLLFGGFLCQDVTLGGKDIASVQSFARLINHVPKDLGEGGPFCSHQLELAPFAQNPAQQQSSVAEFSTLSVTVLAHVKGNRTDGSSTSLYSLGTPPPLYLALLSFHSGLYLMCASGQ